MRISRITAPGLEFVSRQPPCPRCTIVTIVVLVQGKLFRHVNLGTMGQRVASRQKNREPV